MARILIYTVLALEFSQMLLFSHVFKRSIFRKFYAAAWCAPCLPPWGKVAPQGRMRGGWPGVAHKREIARTPPSSVRFADSFSLRAKCRLRRLHSDTRLRAQPRGGSLSHKKPPRGFYTVGRSFLFYCLIALTTLFRSRSSSQTILTGWL